MIMPDQSHIKRVREALWLQPEGCASVMVGARFSRNAMKAGPHAHDFPLWRDLATLLCTRLYPHLSEKVRPVRKYHAAGDDGDRLLPHWLCGRRSQLPSLVGLGAQQSGRVSAKNLLGRMARPIPTSFSLQQDFDKTLGFYGKTPGKTTRVVGVRLPLRTSHRMSLS
jgi:hypothetical protein